jgi:hypothetical protein
VTLIDMEASTSKDLNYRFDLPRTDREHTYVAG